MHALALPQDQLVGSGMQPSTAVINAALAACAQRGQHTAALAVLKTADAAAVTQAAVSEAAVTKAAVTGSLADARSYALAIESCVKADQGEQALQLYQRITVSTVKPLQFLPCSVYQQRQR
jgi:hypothetical protein